ncbi:hypothetical protein JL101_031510 (plasmid) [Skermanella rosea]|uniref:hypothetical protein n=1 Tax=Skermanella rosea TaxID=1817965 RepID=UPI001932F458|nr:hypothetical protein [Skermanella rosea]UEM07465.1 hypothetical protein JL101_031510 [Skermanella rosea]
MSHHPKLIIPGAPEDKLKTLMELARNASPEDRLRIERTIRSIVKARQVVAGIQLNVRKAVARLQSATASAQRIQAQTKRMRTVFQVLRNQI